MIVGQASRSSQTQNKTAVWTDRGVCMCVNSLLGVTVSKWCGRESNLWALGHESVVLIITSPCCGFCRKTFYELIITVVLRSQKFYNHQQSSYTQHILCLNFKSSVLDFIISVSVLTHVLFWIRLLMERVKTLPNCGFCRKMSGSRVISGTFRVSHALF